MKLDIIPQETIPNGKNRQENLTTAQHNYRTGTGRQPVQVPVAEFVEMVMEKEHLVGKPLVWAQWPNEELK